MTRDWHFGPTRLKDGRVRFRLWAPEAAAQGLAVRLELLGMGPLAMTALEDGWYEVITPACPEARYWFRLGDGTTLPDPASRAQAGDVHSPSVVVDPQRYTWRHPGWRGRPWHEAVVYELHVGILGGFSAAAAQLPRLARLGITAVELMPVAEFPGARNWGYDGVLPFAPECSYGPPDALRALIDTAHGLGMMVLLDVVYNHFGPEGNVWPRLASCFFRADRPTPWGPAIDFRQPEVRRFFTENVLYWLEAFHLDGLRFDAVHAMEDAGWLHEVAKAVHEGPGRERHIHLIAENDNNDATLLRDGFTAQWNDDFHHALHVLLTGETHGYYGDYAGASGGMHAPIAHLARALAEGFAYQGEASAYRAAPRGTLSTGLPPTSFVSFLQNHDQIGNRARGERLLQLADPRALRCAVALHCLAPQIPLLFMGEESGSKAPFRYFTDHPPALAEAVRAGRQREFAGMAGFADDAAADGAHATLPDPNAPDTFAAACPVFDDNDWATWYTRLLALRHTQLVPRLAGARTGAATVLSDLALQVSWPLGDGSTLSLWLNLGGEALAVTPVNEPGTLLFASQEPAYPALCDGRLDGYTLLAWLHDAATVDTAHTLTGVRA